MANGVINPFCDTMINDNLLDNAYFLNPVNQRGQTEYTTSGYTIDRWYISTSGGSVTVDSGGVTINGSTNLMSFTQPIEDSTVEYMRGKTVTQSVLTTTGLYSKSLIVPNEGIIDTADFTVDGWNCDLHKNDFRLYSFEKIAATIIACKLEIGNVQTLAHQENGAWVLNEIPNYAEELAKCNRYQLELVRPNSSYGCVGSSFTSNGKSAWVNIPITASMRMVPTVKMAGSWTLVGGNVGTSWRSGVPVASVTVDQMASNAITLLVKANADLDSTQVYGLCYVPQDGVTASMLLDANF